MNSIRPILEIGKLGAVLSNKNIMWATYVIKTSLVATLEKEKETVLINSNNIVYLTQHVQNTIIPTGNQYENDQRDNSHSFLICLVLFEIWYLTLTRHVNLD